GKELDEETGFYYYGARYYNPQTSIWLSVDPLADKYPNMTGYVYTANNPVNYIDPDGQKIIVRGKKQQREFIKSMSLFFNKSEDAFSFKKGELKIDRSKIKGGLDENQEYLLSKVEEIVNDQNLKYKIKEVGKEGNETYVSKEDKDGNPIKAKTEININHPKVEEKL
ncbi:MAG: RHS repeat domain-containing protein, partial [Bacteroidia bacterium]